MRRNYPPTYPPQSLIPPLALGLVWTLPPSADLNVREEGEISSDIQIFHFKIYFVTKLDC